MTCIEESMNHVEHGVSHTTLVLDIDCFASPWHIVILPPYTAKIYWVIQANTYIDLDLCARWITTMTSSSMLYHFVYNEVMQLL